MDKLKEFRELLVARSQKCSDVMSEYQDRRNIYDCAKTERAEIDTIIHLFNQHFQEELS